MMKKKCKNCNYWQNGHEGFWKPEKYGNCKVIDKKLETPKYSSIIGIVEGCVNVENKISSFEYVTQENFGCIHFKEKL
jgi:hypothetical protein